MSVRSVKDSIRIATQTDRTIDKAEAQKILNEAGSSVSGGEEDAIREALTDSSFEITGDARALLSSTVGDLRNLRRHAEAQNRMVSARGANLDVEEKERLTVGVTTVTLGGTAIPDAVKEIVNTARAAGAVAYDVAELEDQPVKDDHGDGYTITGKWSPYPQDIDATGSMAFSHTEVTPAALKADMETETTMQMIKGFRTESQTDRRTGEKHTFQVAEYETVTRKGTGSISSEYDEAAHADPMARQRSGNKWASNFAILADGSFHALPSSRRTKSEGGLILTNPSLARGQRMLFNGHITIRNGVVTSIGMSGRLQKLAVEGEGKFINPLPLLKAWGFEISPNLKLNFEGGGADPKVDANTHVIGE